LWQQRLKRVDCREVDCRVVVTVREHARLVVTVREPGGREEDGVPHRGGSAGSGDRRGAGQAVGDR